MSESSVPINIICTLALQGGGGGVRLGIISARKIWSGENFVTPPIWCRAIRRRRGKFREGCVHLWEAPTLNITDPTETKKRARPRLALNTEGGTSSRKECDEGRVSSFGLALLRLPLPQCSENNHFPGRICDWCPCYVTFLVAKSNPNRPAGIGRQGLPPVYSEGSLVGAWAPRVSSGGVQGLNPVPKQPPGGCRVPQAYTAASTRKNCQKRRNCPLL